MSEDPSTRHRSTLTKCPICGGFDLFEFCSSHSEAEIREFQAQHAINTGKLVIDRAYVLRRTAGMTEAERREWYQEKTAQMRGETLGSAVSVALDKWDDHDRRHRNAGKKSGETRKAAADAWKSLVATHATAMHAKFPSRSVEKIAESCRSLKGVRSVKSSTVKRYVESLHLFRKKPTP